MNKKTIIVLSVVALVLTGWGVRVFYVNNGVASKYDIKTYQLGDQLPLDNANYRVTDITYGAVEKENDYESVPVSIKMEVQNTSDKNITITKLIEAKLAYGMDYYQTMDGEFDVNELRNLPPKTTINITLIYNVTPIYKGKEATLYLDQSLYGRQVMDKYQQGKRYGIAIDL